MLARGTVEVPDEEHVALRVQPLGEADLLPTGGWQLSTRPGPVDVAFLHRLPPTALDSLDFSTAVTGPLDPLLSVAPGLHRLSLGCTGLHDDALAVVSQLHELKALQTWDNHFTDDGVQQLDRLRLLEELYLEEATLTVAAFAFVDRLPLLHRLGVADVPLSETELVQLRSRLPGVDVRE